MAQLESTLRNDPRAEIITRIIPAVLADLTRVTCDIDACLNAPSPVGGAVTPLDPAAPDRNGALAQLRQSLACGDVDSRDRLESLIHHWPCLTPDLAEVGALVDQYRYDEAQQALDALDIIERGA